MALADHSADFRIVNIELVLQLVGHELRHDRDHAATRLDLELLSSLKTCSPQDGRGNNNRLVLGGNGHIYVLPSFSVGRAFGSVKHTSAREIADAEDRSIRFSTERNANFPPQTRGR